MRSRSTSAKVINSHVCVYLLVCVAGRVLIDDKYSMPLQWLLKIKRLNAPHMKRCNMKSEKDLLISIATHCALASACLRVSLFVLSFIIM